MGRRDLFARDSLEISRPHKDTHSQIIQIPSFVSNRIETALCHRGAIDIFPLWVPTQTRLQSFRFSLMGLPVRPIWFMFLCFSLLFYILWSLLCSWVLLCNSLIVSFVAFCLFGTVPMGFKCKKCELFSSKVAAFDVCLSARLCKLVRFCLLHPSLLFFLQFVHDGSRHQRDRVSSAETRSFKGSSPIG